MPQGMSVIWKPSHCPRCGHPIRARDNVPVLGWLMLQGKCRDCGEPISPRYAIVEAVMGATFFVLAYVELFSGGANLPGGPLSNLTGALNVVLYPQWGMIIVYACHCLLFCVLMCVVLCNRDKKSVPTTLMILGFLAAFLLVPYYSRLDLTIPFSNHPAGAFIYCALGGIIGAILGSLASRLDCQSKNDCGKYFSLNLLSGSTLAGLLLGWQVVFAMCVVLLVAAVSRLRNKGMCSPLVVDAIFCATFFQLLVWEKLNQAIL